MTFHTRIVRNTRPKTTYWYSLLTALTGLTHLALINLYDGAGDGAAVALVRSLKHLELLDVRSCSIDLGSMAFLAAVGQLRQLKYLYPQGNGGLTEQSLMQLTGLPRLQHLGVDENEEVTDEVLDRFWAAVRQ
jgi:hypothetical protein